MRPQSGMVSIKVNASDSIGNGEGRTKSRRSSPSRPRDCKRRATIHLATGIRAGKTELLPRPASQETGHAKDESHAVGCDGFREMDDDDENRDKNPI